MVEVESESCLGTDMIEAVEGHLQGEREKKGDKYIKRGDLDMKTHGEREERHTEIRCTYQQSRGTMSSEKLFLLQPKRAPSKANPIPA